MNDRIRQAVDQWKAKAESDWKTVEILLESEQCPAETVCFHCQQFVEKLLKGFLTLREVESPRTHDIRRLIQLAEPYAPELLTLIDRSDILTVHGVETRYPGDWPKVDSEEMGKVVDLAREFRKILLERLK